MRTKSLDELPADLSAVVDGMEAGEEPMILTRAGKPVAVVMGFADFLGHEETAHLLSTRANAVRLLEGLAAFERGSAAERTLAE